MSMFFGTKPGSWWLRSTTDPRWNTQGRASVGMFGMPQECTDKIELFTRKYGEPPADLEWGYEKD